MLENKYGSIKPRTIVFMVKFIVNFRKLLPRVRYTCKYIYFFYYFPVPIRFKPQNLPRHVARTDLSQEIV